MTYVLASRLISFAWIGWLVYWLLAAFKVKRKRRRDALWVLATQRAFMWVAALLFFAPRSWFPPLTRRLIAATSAILWTSVALTIIGLAFSIWARIVLAGNWSSEVELKEGHELISAGPYARLRHPIYSGIIAAAAGAALLRGTLSALLAFVLFAAGFWIKARREEILLSTEFGAALDSYRHRTGMFLPRLR